jgi:hypothetical protein
MYEDSCLEYSFFVSFDLTWEWYFEFNVGMKTKWRGGGGVDEV